MNTNTYHLFAPPPIGLAYLIKPLRKAGHEVMVVDLMFSITPEEQLTSALDLMLPDVVGMSIRNVDNQNMTKPVFFLPSIKVLADICKSKPIKALIIGGAACHTFPKESLLYMNADFAFIGQGEHGLPILLDSLAKNRTNFETIPGLVWRGNGFVKINKPDISGYGEGIASQPDWSEFTLANYKTEFSGSVVTKAGCSFSCSYCNSPSIFENNFTFRKPQDIASELQELSRRGVESTTLVDSCFNVPLNYAKDVLATIAWSGVSMRLFTVMVPSRGHFDEEMVKMYKRAGGVGVMLGVETLSDRMLKVYNKQFTAQDALNCGKLLHKHGIRFSFHAMFGGPGEDRESIIECMERLPEIQCSEFVYNIGIRIMPNTSLHYTAISSGDCDSSASLFTPHFYVSKTLDISWAESYIHSKLQEYGLCNPDARI